MAAIRETIAVVDKSGKVVTTSKHLLGVFKEARNAYRERKAEIQAEKQAKIAEREARRVMAALAIEDKQDKRSVASSRKSGRSRTGQSRHHSGRSHHHRDDHPRALHYEQDLHHDPYSPAPPVPRSLQEFGRRHTEQVVMSTQPAAPVVRRAKTESHVDMDLAYGEVHPSVLQRYEPAPAPAPPPADEEELNVLVTKVKVLLEEAECLQHSATAAIAHLQKHPDAMAAVALTLAEISNLVCKMAPGIIATLKASAPAVFALLASPQFLIAAGVGIGVTIVMFGGYKIIKKITAANNNQDTTNPDNQPKAAAVPADGVDELMELQSEHLSRVEVWRRGVADAEAGSASSAASTVVDGEFITPTAAAMSGLDLSKIPRGGGGGYSKYEDLSTAASSRRSRRSRLTKRSSRSGGGGSEEKNKKKRKEKEKEKEKDKSKTGRSSKLRLMFLA